MELIFLVSFAILVGLIYAGFQAYYNLSYKNKKIDDAVLEENVKTADLYEIIYLKLGEEAVKESAIGHLVESGYLENKGGVLKVNPEKDITLVTELEKSLMKAEIGSRYDLFIFQGDLAPFRDVIRKSAKKAQDLRLFYKRGKGFRTVEEAFILFSLLFAFCYICYGRQFNWFLRLIFIGVLSFASIKFFYDFILEKPTAIRMKGGTGEPANIFGAAEHFLTSNGKRYIQLFEERNFPVDPIIKKYLPTCPCSVFN